MSITMRLLILHTSLMIALVGCLPVDAPREDEKAYTIAFNTYNQNKDYPTAKILFIDFIDNYPYSEKLDNAEYYLGRTYMQLANTNTIDSVLQNYTLALESFSLLDQKSSHFADAKYQTALCREEVFSLDSTIFSRMSVIASYEYVYNTFPLNPLAAKAKTSAERLKN